MVVRTRSLAEMLHLITRRRWLILVPFALGVAAAPILARYAPQRYRSEALILVLPQRVPETFVKTTVNQPVEERLPAITEKILSRFQLEAVINELDLYKAERSNDVMENVVEKMRGDISTSAAGKTVDSFRVSYVSGSPKTAQKVADKLASLYINQNLQDRQSQAGNTTQFLDTQLTQAKDRLVEQEQRLEAYRKSHAGQLPSQLQGNLQAIQNANVQLQAVNESTNRAMERRLLFEHQITDIQAIPMPPAPVAVPRAAEGPAPSSTAQLLEAAQGRLAASLQRYTPDHPDVVSLQRTVAELTAKLEGETPLGPAQEAPDKPVAVVDATQRKKILDLQSELAVIDLQLTANRTEEGRLKQTIAEYQAKVDAVPTRESELVELTRDYSTMQTAYASLLTKLQDARIAGSLEDGQIAEQFHLLDAASLPEKPYNEMRRVAIIASGAAGGLVLGLLLVIGLEYRDSSFRDAEEVQKAISVPVLALIPMMTSERERRSAKRRGWAMDVAGMGVLLAAGAVLAIWQLRM